MTPNRRPGGKDDPKIVGPASPPASHASKPHGPPGLIEELVTRRLEAASGKIRLTGKSRTKLPSCGPRIHRRR